MNLTNLVEYYEADDDRLTKQKPTDSRKIRLTLRHLNKLRKMQEIKKADLVKRKDFFDKIYSRPAPEPAI
jgi:hypothetical protein|tara:strand:- start:302 stop:511 length:210 start_codon:yes stop_codon:yes gene_type:complete